MKKLLLTIVTLFALFFSLNLTVNAQAVDEPPLPGECGMIGAACCYYEPLNTVDTPQTGIGGVDQLVNSFVTSVINNVAKPIFAPYERIVQDTVQPCVVGSPSTPGNVTDPSCKCLQPSVTPMEALMRLCGAIKTPGEQGRCTSCLAGGGIWSSAGCIYATAEDFIQKTVFGWGIGLAGGLALLCIIYAAFQMQSSQGNPEKIKKAQEMLTSCIMGLMLIIFAVFILRLIGVNILQIPGFT